MGSTVPVLIIPCFSALQHRHGDATFLVCMHVCTIVYMRTDIAVLACASEDGDTPLSLPSHSKFLCMG